MSSRPPWSTKQNPISKKKERGMAGETCHCGGISECTQTELAVTLLGTVTVHWGPSLARTVWSVAVHSATFQSDGRDLEQ